MPRHPAPRSTNTLAMAAVPVLLCLLLAGCSSTAPATSPQAPMTSGTPTQSATVSAAAPVLLPGPGVELTTEAEITALTWADDATKAFLVKQLTRQYESGAIFSCAAVTVQGYRLPDLITGGVGSCSGAATLWGRIGGEWIVLAETQDTPQCDDLRAKGWTQTIPEGFVGHECMQGDRTVVYAP